MAIPPPEPGWDVHSRPMVELLLDHLCDPEDCQPPSDAASWPVPDVGHDLDLRDRGFAPTAWMTWEAPR